MCGLKQPKNHRCLQYHGSISVKGHHLPNQNNTLSSFLHLPWVCPLNGSLGQPLVTVGAELPQYTIDILEKLKPPSISGFFLHSFGPDKVLQSSLMLKNETRLEIIFTQSKVWWLILLAREFWIAGSWISQGKNCWGLSWTELWTGHWVYAQLSLWDTQSFHELNKVLEAHKLFKISNIEQNNSPMVTNLQQSRKRASCIIYDES